MGCSGRPNHAVTAVGYTPQFVLVKNSWGTGWGDKGFVKFTRNYNNCGLFKYSSYPTLKKTKPDPPKPTCKDKRKSCNKNKCSKNKYAKKCQKTCGKCTEVCPSGTIRCSDGVCRHEHMC